MNLTMLWAQVAAVAALAAWRDEFNFGRSGNPRCVLDATYGDRVFAEHLASDPWHLRGWEPFPQDDHAD